MKISAVFHQPAATSIGIGRLCWLSIVLIALISSCFILTTVRIPKRAVKGQRAGMSNGSKSVDDGWSGVVTKNRVKKRKERADWVMHSIQSVRQSDTVSHTRVSRLAPPSGLRGSCVEAIFLYVTCLWKDTCLQSFWWRYKCPCLQPPDLTGIKIQ